MKKLLKIVAWLLGALVALAVVAAVVIPLVFDPNDYRDEISAAVKKQTGRDLKIEGQLKLSLFPWLGVEMGAMQLSNAKGFGPQPFARIEGVDVKVKLLPLLHKQVEMDKVVLRGLELNLGRRADGSSNWDDLTSRQPSAAAEPKTAPKKKDEAAQPGMALGGLAVGGLELRDAKVTWDDRVSGGRYAIDHFNLISGAVALKQPFDIQLDFDVASNQPELRGHVQFRSRVTLDLNDQNYRLDTTTLSSDLQGKLLPGGKLAAKLQANVVADLKAQTLQVDGLRLDTMGIALDGSVRGSRIIDAPQFSGTLKSNEFVPQDLIAQLAIKLPEMADPSALTKASLAFAFDAGLDSVAVKDLQVRVDDTKLTGSASVHNFKRPALRYDLSVDQVDADRYLPPPPPKDAPKATPATAAAGGATQLPLAQLRALDVQGEAKVGKLKVMNLRSTDIHATLNAKGGVIHLYPVGAKLYDGSYDGNLTLDVRGAEPVSSMDEKLAGVQAGPLLKDFMGKDYVTGKGSVSAKLTARGIDPMAARKSLNGNVAFKFENGAVNGINLAQLIRNAYASYKKQPAPKDEVKQTDFAAITGTATIKDGLVTNKDLDAKSPLFRVAGKGTANLVSEAIDYRVSAAIVGTLEGQGGKELDDLKGLTVPVHIGGTFRDPKFNVELGELLDAKAKQKIDVEKKKAQEQVNKKIEQEKKNLQQEFQKPFKLKF